MLHLRDSRNLLNSNTFSSKYIIKCPPLFLSGDETDDISHASTVPEDSLPADEISKSEQLKQQQSSAGAAAGTAAVAKRDSIKEDLFEELDVSASFAGKSVMLSMSDVPDISAHDAQQIVEMFADQLAESITGEHIDFSLHNYYTFFG